MRIGTLARFPESLYEPMNWDSEEASVQIFSLDESEEALVQIFSLDESRWG